MMALYSMHTVQLNIILVSIKFAWNKPQHLNRMKHSIILEEIYLHWNVIKEAILFSELQVFCYE